MGMFKREELVYNDSRTKQSFKDSTDINKILQKAQVAGTLSHLEQFGGEYKSFQNFDFFEAQLQIARAQTIFERLPSEIRREFNNDPGKFFAYANDPENVDNLHKLMPELARPGRQFAAVNAKVAAAKADDKTPPDSKGPSEKASETPPQEVDTGKKAEKGGE